MLLHRLRNNPTISHLSTPPDKPSQTRLTHLHCMMSGAPGNSLTSATAFSPSLEAIKLAAQMYNAAREGNKQVLEEALLDGLPPNLTNEKGDTLVSPFRGSTGDAHPAFPVLTQPSQQRSSPVSNLGCFFPSSGFSL